MTIVIMIIMIMIINMILNNHNKKQKKLKRFAAHDELCVGLHESTVRNEVVVMVGCRFKDI